MMEEVPEGTKIHYANDIEIASPFFRLCAHPLIGWYALRYRERAVTGKLRQMLE